MVYSQRMEIRWIFTSYSTTFILTQLSKYHLYTVVGTLVALVVNIPAGYALSRKELVGRKWMSILYIIPMFVSGGLIPTYLTVKNVGLIDTFWVMVIPFAVSSYNIIVARTFFNNSIPDGMWEAAQIDGCGTIRYFIKIVVPLSKAIIAVIGLWTAVGIWNSWFNALIYLTNENLQPLQLILRRLLISNQMLQSQATGEVASDLRIKADMMKYAAIVISTAPIMLLYPFVQKYFNQGVMIGALKEQEKNMKNKSFTYLFLGTVTLAGLTACANSNNANKDDKSGARFLIKSQLFVGLTGEKIIIKVF